MLNINELIDNVVWVNDTIKAVVKGYRPVGKGYMVDLWSPERGEFSTSLINITFKGGNEHA